MGTVGSFLDTICFISAFLSIVYLLVFAISAQLKSPAPYPQAALQHRILVVFPAYKEDMVIVESVRSFLEQDYPADLFRVIVISDQMKEYTDQKLATYPIDLVKADYKNSSKAAALNLAIRHSADTSYDLLVILDADNKVEKDFLHQINNAYDFGIQAMQAHRKSKGESTDVSVLDTVSEEINNSIFRKGHVRLGFSSALSGSGMAFDYHWFVSHIQEITSAGEDKELELLLLRDEIYIDYLEGVNVYDEKVAKASAFYQQRRRWIAAQFSILRKGLHSFLPALLSRNWDYCDKVSQWTILPRIFLLGFTTFMGFLWLFIQWTTSLKWWFILFLLLSALALAMPDKLYNASFRKAIRKLPLLFVLTTINLFRTKGVNKRFIHTTHGEVSQHEDSD